MAISWGAFDYLDNDSSKNGIRVGIEVTWGSVTHTSASVVATAKIYTENKWVYNDDQKLTFSGVISGEVNFKNNVGTNNSGGGAILRATKTYTYPYPAGTYDAASVSAKTFRADLSGVTNFGGTTAPTPFKSLSSTPPARPSTVPTAPTSVTSTPGNGSVTIGYAAPTSNGGATISSYEYSTNNFNFTVIETNPFTVTGLSNGVSQEVWVRAKNIAGPGPVASATSTPRTTPGTPGISSSPANGSISVSYTAPASDGGESIDYYEFSTDGTNYSAAPASPFSVNGANGTAITVRVRAVNAAGAGGVASTTNTPRTISGPPTSFSGNSSVFGQITLTWAAPSSNGGATITSYILRNGSTTLQSANLTSFTHTGLLPFTDYSYTVVAVNASGEGNIASLTVKTMGGIAKVWNGTSWVTVLPKVWTGAPPGGSGWADAQARMWNGSEWKHGI